MSPSQDKKTLLAKLATFFAIGFAVSLGLCGINFIAAGGAFPEPRGGDAIIITAYLEVAGMAICAAGLLVVGLIALAQAISRRFSNTSSSSEEDQ